MAKKNMYSWIFLIILIFDLSASHGRAIVTLINGMDAQYTQVLQDGDKIEVYWKENY